MPTTTTPGGFLVQQELEARDPAAYDKRTGLYTIQRRWLINVDWINTISLPLAGAGKAAVGDAIPETFTITHEDGITPVTMVAVARNSEVVRAKTDTLCAQAVLSITYEGHVCMQPSGGTTGAATPHNGVVAFHTEQGTKSEQILVSYDLDATDRRKAIGPNNEGTNIFVPQLRLVIVQNVLAANYYTQMYAAQNITGMVNENGWRDPAFSVSWDEGIWLYLGAQQQQNRDGTITFTHIFDYDLHKMPEGTTTSGVPVYYGHKYLWYFLTELKEVIGGISKIVKRATGDPQLSKVYLVAGEAGAPTTTQFANLFTVY